MFKINNDCFTESLVFDPLSLEGTELKIKKDGDLRSKQKPAALTRKNLIEHLESNSQAVGQLLQNRSLQEIEQLVLNLLTHNKLEKEKTKDLPKGLRFSRCLANLLTPILQARMSVTPPTEKEALFLFSLEDARSSNLLCQKFKEKMQDIALLKNILVKPFGADPNGQFGIVYRRLLTLIKVHQRDYYFFTHGMSDKNEIACLFSKALAKALHPRSRYKQFKFLRWPTSDKPKENAFQFLAKNQGHLDREFWYTVGEELLSVDANPFNRDYLESASHMCRENTNITSNVSKIVGKILGTLPNLPWASIRRLTKKVEALANQAENREKIGHKFFIAIPKKLVDNPDTCPVYESLPFSYPAHDFKTPIKLLPELQLGKNITVQHPYNVFKVNVQARILASCLKPGSGIKIFRLGGQSSEIRRQLKTQVQEIVQEIIQESNTPATWSRRFITLGQTIYECASYACSFFRRT